MNLLISLIYAPVVFYSLQNFELQIVSLCIFLFSLIWLVLTLKKGIKEYFFSVLYIFISILAYFLDSFTVLKVLPFLISFFISCFILYTYISRNSFIFIFLEKIKKEVLDDEKEYIQKSTLFWFFTSLVNLAFHSFILYNGNVQYWIFYSSIGWYFIFIIAGIIQFTHKKLYFNKEKDV